MPTRRRDERLARRRRLLVERLAATKTPIERLDVALGYLRAMLRDVPADRAAKTAAVVADQLVTHADHLAEGGTR